MFRDHGGRHYWFSENLARQGYQPTIFCASTGHNTSFNVEVESGRYTTAVVNQIPFVFIKTLPYQGNGLQRIRNMITFYMNLRAVAPAYAKIYGKPDVILASSVHPLTLVAGIQVARWFRVPCICEVRDLWPESIVAYGLLSRRNFLVRVLHHGEKWIYKESDALIMTWPGGRDYIIDQGWTGQVNMAKVSHISNGVSLDSFDRNSIEYPATDENLSDRTRKNIVYAGSISKVNNIGLLLDAAKLVQARGLLDVRFLIYGDGDEIGLLKERCHTENIRNVVFKGRIEKRRVPSVLRQAYVNILHNSSSSLDKYGQSQNKLFEYLAAGRCIIQTYSVRYSVIEKANCGICVKTQSAEGIADAVIAVCRDDSECRVMGENARKAAYEYDFSRLTQQLIGVIENIEVGSERFRCRMASS